MPRELDLILDAIEQVRQTTKANADRLDMKLEAQRLANEKAYDYLRAEVEKLNDQLVDLQRWRSWVVGIAMGVGLIASRVWDKLVDWVIGHVK